MTNTSNTNDFDTFGCVLIWMLLIICMSIWTRNDCKHGFEPPQLFPCTTTQNFPLGAVLSRPFSCRSALHQRRVLSNSEAEVNNYCTCPTTDLWPFHQIARADCHRSGVPHPKQTASYKPFSNWLAPTYRNLDSVNEPCRVWGLSATVSTVMTQNVIPSTNKKEAFVESYGFWRSFKRTDQRLLCLACHGQTYSSILHFTFRW